MPRLRVKDARKSQQEAKDEFKTAAELSTVRTNVDALVADLDAAISEADQFVASRATSDESGAHAKKG